MGDYYPRTRIRHTDQCHTDPAPAHDCCRSWHETQVRRAAARALRDEQIEQRRYLRGDCDLLADVVAEITGWTRVYVAPAGDLTGGHVMVRLPDRRLLDIRGLHAADDDPRRHYPVALQPGLMVTPSQEIIDAGEVPDVVIAEVTAEHEAAWRGADPTPDPRVRQTAQRLLTRVGLA